MTHSLTSAWRIASRPYSVTSTRRVRTSTRFKAASPREWPAQLAWAYYFDAAERLAQRDVAGATAQVRLDPQTLENAPEWMRDHLVAKAVRYFLATGQARHALAALERFSDREFFYAYYRAYTAFALEDSNTARDYISDVPLNNLVASAVWLMARLGIPDEAERWLDKSVKPTDRRSIGSSAAAFALPKVTFEDRFQCSRPRGR